MNACIVLRMEEGKFIPIDSIDLERVIKTFYKPTMLDYNIELNQDFEGFVINKHQVMSKWGGNIYLMDNDYDNWKGRKLLCNLEELKEWAEGDKSMVWVSWIIGSIGLFVEILGNYYKKHITRAKMN